MLSLHHVGYHWHKWGTKWNPKQWQIILSQSQTTSLWLLWKTFFAKLWPKSSDTFLWKPYSIKLFKKIFTTNVSVECFLEVNSCNCSQQSPKTIWYYLLKNVDNKQLSGMFWIQTSDCIISCLLRESYWFDREISFIKMLKLHVILR